MMKISLLVVGNELLNGKIQDKNTHFLAQYTKDNYFSLQQVSIIKDNKEQFFQSLNTLKRDSDLIIMTGGLGPTKDDMTKSWLAEYFTKEIQFNDKAKEIVESHYTRGNRETYPSTKNYFKIPQDFQALYNPVGYAPGLLFIDKSVMFAACPGVPSEYQAMVVEEIIPKALEVFGSPQLLRENLIIKTFGVPESKIFNVLAPKLWDELEVYGEVSSLPHGGGVDIGVVISSQNKDDLNSKIQECIDLVKSTAVKNHIFHIGPEALPEIIIKKATEKKIKFGFSESCTGGLNASRITDVPGSSSSFWGSIVSYSNEVKNNTLNVDDKTLENYGAVSEQTAKEMALGAKNKMGVDIAISTTGIAGPGGGSDQKPVGTIGIGWAYKNINDSVMLKFSGNRLALKERFSQEALYKLIEIIENY